MTATPALASFARGWKKGALDFQLNSMDTRQQKAAKESNRKDLFERVKTEVGTNEALFNYLDFVAENYTTNEEEDSEALHWIIEVAKTTYAKKSGNTKMEQLTNYVRQLDNFIWWIARGGMNPELVEKIKNYRRNLLSNFVRQQMQKEEKEEFLKFLRS